MDLHGNFQHNNILPKLKQTCSGRLFFPHLSSWKGERVVSTVNRDRFCYYIRPQNINAEQEKVSRHTYEIAIRPNDCKTDNSFLKEKCSNNSISDALNLFASSNVKEKKIYSMKINTRQSLKSRSKVNAYESLKSGPKINLKQLTSPHVKDDQKCNPHVETSSRKGYFKKLLKTKHCRNQSLLIEKDPKLKQNCVVVLEKIIFNDLESKLNINLNDCKTLDFEPKLELRHKNSQIPIKMNLRKSIFNKIALKKRQNGRENLSSNSPLHKKSFKCDVSHNPQRIENNLNLHSPNLRSGLRRSRLQSKLDAGVSEEISPISKMSQADISHRITSCEKTKVHDMSITRTSLRIKNICKNITQEISPRKKSRTYKLNKSHILEVNDRKSISPIKKILSQENKLPEKDGNSKHNQFETSLSESKRKTYETDKISQKENIKEKVLIQIFSPQGEISLEVLSPKCSRGKNNQFKLGERKLRHSKFDRKQSNHEKLLNASKRIHNESEDSYRNLRVKSIASPLPIKQTRSVSSKKNQFSQRMNSSSVLESTLLKTKSKSRRKDSNAKIKTSFPKNYSITLSNPVDENSPRLFNANVQDQKKQIILKSSRKSLIEQHICYLSKHDSSLANSVNEKLNSSLSQSPTSALLLHIKTPESTIYKEVKHEGTDQDQSVLKEIKPRKVSKLKSSSPLKNQSRENSNINDESDFLPPDDKVTKSKLKLSSKKLSPDILKQNDSDIIDKCGSLLSIDKASKLDLISPIKRLSSKRLTKEILKHNDSDIIDKYDSLLSNDKVAKLDLISPLKRLSSKRLSRDILERNDSDIIDKCDSLLSNDKSAKLYLTSPVKRLSREILKQNDSDIIDKNDSLLSKDKATKTDLISSMKRLSRKAVKKQKFNNSSVEYKTPVKRHKQDNLNLVDGQLDLLLSNEILIKPNRKMAVKRQKRYNCDIIDKCDLLLSNDKRTKPKFKTPIKRKKHKDSYFVDGECDLLLSNDKVKKLEPKLSGSSSVNKALSKPKKMRSKSERPNHKQLTKKSKKTLTPNVLLKDDKSKDKNSTTNICMLNSKQPSKGTMKRKHWFVEKLNKQSEGHEDDIFEAKEFEIAEELFGEDSDSSELYQHMLTPKREFTLVPQNGKVPAYDPCPSPDDLTATTRKEADEYLYRRIKRQKNKVAEAKQNPNVQTFEEKQAELDIEKILQDVKKLNKPKKRKRDSEIIDEDEDFYFSDVSEDSAESFIND